MPSKNLKIGFLSHLDTNLYLFRLPIMLELIKQGYKVYAIIPKGIYEKKFASLGIEPIFYDIDRKSLNPFKELLSIYDIYKKIKPLDLDILCTFMLKPNIYGAIAIALLSHKTSTKLVSAVTGLGSFYIDKSLKSLLIKKLTQILYKYSFKKSSKVIFQNNDDLSLFIELKILPKDKAVLIKSSGIDTQKFCLQNVQTSQIEDLKLTLKINNKDMIILMVARLIKHKGVDEYLQAANILKDKYPYARFWLVGGEDKGNKFNIDISSLKHQDIEVLGEREDIKELIALSDIFVLPSYREGVPRTLLEAGAMSKPIVTTDTIGCKEVVVPNTNGFLIPIKSAQALANAIEKLIVNKDLRVQFGKNSRIHIQKEFDIKKVTKAYLNVYENI